MWPAIPNTSRQSSLNASCSRSPANACSAMMGRIWTVECSSKARSSFRTVEIYRSVVQRLICKPSVSSNRWLAAGNHGERTSRGTFATWPGDGCGFSRKCRVRTNEGVNVGFGEIPTACPGKRRQIRSTAARCPQRKPDSTPDVYPAPPRPLASALRKIP